MSLLIALAAAAYYPPTVDDAQRAVAARLFGGVQQASLEPQKPGFDLSVTLERCTFQESHEVRGGFGVTVLDAGHDCVFSVSRRARPDYRLRGFFHHDGIDWRYYGPVEEPLVAETQSHGVGGGFSGVTPKPGSTLYRGDAGGDLLDPYRRIFTGYDWFFEPAGQPPHDDIYTD
jgi:hypothetical protein